MKQRLSEALAQTPFETHKGHDAIIAAARLVERLLPGECGSCEGQGSIQDAALTGRVACGGCRGSGRVWDEGIVDHFASVIFNAEFAEVDWATIKAEYAEDGANFEDHHRFYYDAGRAVLSALVELLTEKVGE